MIDARDLPPTLDALQFRLAPMLTDEPPTGRTVILLDTYELLADIDAGVREEIAPRLPADALLIIAGQYPPGRLADRPRLGRPDPGDQPAEPERAPNAAPTFPGVGSRCPCTATPSTSPTATRLALALVGEVHQGTRQFRTAAFRRRHRANWSARWSGRHRPPRTDAPWRRRRRSESSPNRCSRALLDEPDAAELFDWMRQLPFVDPGPQGLYLHDLARTVLASDLRWRHPERYVQLHSRARSTTWSTGRLEGADPAAQAGGLMDLMYLHTELRRIPAGAGRRRRDRQVGAGRPGGRRPSAR